MLFLQFSFLNIISKSWLEVRPDDLNSIEEKFFPLLVDNGTQVIVFIPSQSIIAWIYFSY